METATLITDPAGNADMEIHCQISLQFARRAGKTVHYCGWKLISISAENFREVLVRVAFVEKERHCQFYCQLNLSFKPAVLERARREISIVVEPAFTNRHYLRC